MMNDWDEIIQELGLLEQLQYLQDVPQEEEDVDASVPFPGFEIPEGIIPKELLELNIALDPMAFILCDNGIGQLIDFIGSAIGGILSGFKACLDGIVFLIKSLVRLITDGAKELIEALKYTIVMLKRFYCESQHIRLIIAKTAPVLRAKVGLTEIDPNIPEPPPSAVYPQPPLPTDGQQQFPDATATQVFNALLELRNTLLNKVGANLLQSQENQQARYEDLRNQLLILLPPNLRDKITGESEVKTEEEKIKAERQKYIEGIENSIEAIQKSILDLISGKANPQTILEEMILVDDYVESYKPTAIADLPPLDPITPDIPYDVTPDAGGITYRNLLEFVERLTQKTAIETINNNILRLDSNDRIYYQSLRKIIDAVRDVQSAERVREQKEREAKEREQQQTGAS